MTLTGGERRQACGQRKPSCPPPSGPVLFELSWAPTSETRHRAPEGMAEELLPSSPPKGTRDRRSAQHELRGDKSGRHGGPAMINSRRAGHVRKRSAAPCLNWCGEMWPIPSRLLLRLSICSMPDLLIGPRSPSQRSGSMKWGCEHGVSVGSKPDNGAQSEMPALSRKPRETEPSTGYSGKRLFAPSAVLRPRHCALGRIRTCDTRFRKPVLYPLSYEGVNLQRVEGVISRLNKHSLASGSLIPTGTPLPCGS